MWIILRRWAALMDGAGDGILSAFPWQPACQVTFDTRSAAEAHLRTLEPDFPGREFKVVKQTVVR
jgi:hypothetical protein